MRSRSKNYIRVPKLELSMVESELRPRVQYMKPLVGLMRFFLPQSVLEVGKCNRFQPLKQGVELWGKGLSMCF